MTKLYRGKLKRIVRIEKPPTATDEDYGTPTGPWEVVADNVRAEILDILPGSANAEQILRSVELTSRPARVRMDYREDIDGTMRIVVKDRGNRVLQVATEPAEIGERDGIEFIGVQYKPAGEA